MATAEGPDQGRAWLIAFAACIINMILSGISRMIGMLYVAVLDEYGVSRQEATLPFTVRNSIRCLSGPIVGIVGQKCGIRIVTICGGLVAALGATLCSVAPNVLWLTVFWGGIHGFGFAFANTLFQVVVNQYFEKYRATASGIALSGACLGSLGFPFMMEFFLERFGLPGTFLMLGGVIMHVLPPALFLRVPPWITKKAAKVSRPKPSEDEEAVRKEEDIRQCQQLSNTTSMSNNPVEGIEIVGVRRLTGDRSTTHAKRLREHVVTVNTIFTGTENGAYKSDGDDDHQVGQIPSQKEGEQDHHHETGGTNNIKIIIQLYTNPVYVLTNICMATYILIFIPILTVIVDYGEDKGLPESSGKYLINAMACGDLIGRLCFGWVTDKGFITIPRFMTLTLVAQGIIIAMFPFAMTLLTFMVLLALYGVMAGSILVLFPILVLKYVSIDVQPVAMGCVGFLSGVASFAIPPLIAKTVSVMEGPDQGLAWFVAFSACIINMILSGISRMIGMLYVAVIEAYGVSRQEATLPFTLRNAIKCLAGPLVGMAGQKCGIRAVTLAGGVVAALGAGLCAIAPSVLWLTIFWGGIHGIGFAFANTLFQVVVNQYFEKHRATASGIALSGACFGSLGFPFLMEFFLDSFGLAGTFLILCGLVMNVLPPAMFLRSPPWIKNQKRRKSQFSEVDADGAPRTEDDIRHCKELFRSTSMTNDPAEGIDVISVRCLTIGDHPTTNDENPPDHEVAVATIFDGMNGTCGTDLNNDDQSPEQSTAPKEKLRKRDGSCMSSIKTMVKLYKNPVYVMINICLATYVIIFIPILTVIVDYSYDKGLSPSSGKYLINTMACGDLVGRLCFGWVTDKGFITIPRFMTLTLVAQGAIIAMFPFAMSFMTFMPLVTLYGAMAGSMLVLFPILVLKYVPFEEQPLAMGSVGLLAGLVSFAIPPLIGHFRDEVGSYDGMFYITAGISIFSGMLWMLDPVVAKFQVTEK